VQTSFLQRLPFTSRYFRALAPLYPRAFESFDLRAYDLVVSSTTAWAKGVITRPGATHVSYINTVSRFAFDYDRYVGGFGAGTLARPMIDRLVAWDQRAARRPTAFVANSQNVRARVQAYYRRDAAVLPCPVDVDRFTVHPRGDGRFLLVVSRLLSYKRIDRAIRACALAGVQLLVAGTGPAEPALRALAKGTTTSLLGFVPDVELDRLMAQARGVILPGIEDFGLVPLEAAAAGRATIAIGRGGACETIIDGVTGTLVANEDDASLAAAIAAFDPAGFDPARLRAHAERFAPAVFTAKLRALVEAIRLTHERGEEVERCFGPAAATGDRPAGGPGTTQSGAESFVVPERS